MPFSAGTSGSERRGEPGVVMVRNRAEGTFPGNWEALSRCKVPGLDGRCGTEKERWTKGAMGRAARGG